LIFLDDDIEASPLLVEAHTFMSNTLMFALVSSAEIAKD
jgi:hypothetical protein